MQAHSRYREVQVQTATPGDLLISLYDGLFRFLDGAIVCFERDQRARGMEFCSKAHAIVSELYIALDHPVAPELCGRLSGIYNFAMSRIASAQRTGNPVLLHEAKQALGPLREGFKLAVPKAALERASTRRAAPLAASAISR